MRFLIVHPGPSFSVADVHNGWTEALRASGQEVHEFNLDRRLQFYSHALIQRGETEQGGPVFGRAMSHEQAVELALDGLLSATYRLWPDVLLVVSGLFVDERVLDVIRSRGTRIVLLHTEEPYEHARQLALARYADVNLINDPVNIDAFRAVAPTWYLPHAYSPERHHPRPPVPTLDCDFAFCGTGYPSRITFLESVDFSGLSVKLAGNWIGLPESSPLRRWLIGTDDYCMDNETTANLYASAKVGANLYRREADPSESAAGWAMGPREVELAAMGCFFLREPRGEGDEVLPMLPTFRGPGEFGEKLRWWLAHPEHRADAATAARTAVTGRTFAAHSVALLQLLGA